jgi:phosphoheptose isomerase
MSVLTPAAMLRGHAHLAASALALQQMDGFVDRLEGWGTVLANSLQAGGRLLAAGNGGSAAQAQHLTAELVGRYCQDRRPFSAIALHAEASTVTALLNDYPPVEIYSRQVRAHGRPGDVLIVLSASGRSPNIVAAVEAGCEAGLSTFALTGPGPNPVAAASDEAVCIDAPAMATVQEMHQIAVHLICAAFDLSLDPAP